uniref:DUF3778 domain-containing protein n=1 Tax=Oryza rufipogon TaxID=4529 RepID=A0A0E0Q5G1_ORYRU
METQGFSRRGFAAELCRSDSLLLFSLIWKLRGTNLLSPVTSTPRSTAQHQTFDLCRFRGDSCRSLPVCQAVSMSMETQGFSRRGFAAELCRSDSLLLFSLIWKLASLDWLASTLLEMASCFALSCILLRCIGVYPLLSVLVNKVV